MTIFHRCAEDDDTKPVAAKPRSEWYLEDRKIERLAGVLALAGACDVQDNRPLMCAPLRRRGYGGRCFFVLFCFLNL